MQFQWTIRALSWKGPLRLQSKRSGWDAICTNCVTNSGEGLALAVAKTVCEAVHSKQLFWNPSRPSCFCAVFEFGLKNNRVRGQVPLQDLLANWSGFNRMELSNQSCSTTVLFITIYSISTELQKIATTPLGFNIQTQITHMRWIFFLAVPESMGTA